MFWNKLKAFMDEKELDFLERKVRAEKGETRTLELTTK